MGSVCIQMPATAPEVAGQMADAAQDERRLRRALVGGGAAKAVAALLLALSRAPVGVTLFGALEVAVGFWVAGDPERRRGWGRVVLWVSVVPLVVVAGLGGFAVLK
ncbi:hypothetical protein EJB05_39502, partial [Eragrostis curvula]